MWHIFLCLDSNPKLIEKIVTYIGKGKDLQFVLERVLTPCSSASGRQCVTSWKKACLHSVIYIILFCQGPLIFVIKSMLCVLCSCSKAEWFQSKICLERRNEIIICVHDNMRLLSVLKYTAQNSSWYLCYISTWRCWSADFIVFFLKMHQLHPLLAKIWWCNFLFFNSSIKSPLSLFLFFHLVIKLMIDMINVR